MNANSSLEVNFFSAAIASVSSSHSTPLSSHGRGDKFVAKKRRFGRDNDV